LRAEKQLQETPPEGTPAASETGEDKKLEETVDSEEEVDEVTQMILNKERENAEKAAAFESMKK